VAVVDVVDVVDVVGVLEVLSRYVSILFSSIIKDVATFTGAPKYFVDDAEQTEATLNRTKIEIFQLLWPLFSADR
jgi:hypothetical protein